MKSFYSILPAWLCLSFVATLVTSSQCFAACDGGERFKVLVFSKTAGFRHGSIPAGINAIQQLGMENNFQVDTSEDSTVMTDGNLAQYAAVIFLMTTGEILNDTQQGAFERYIQAGGG